MNVNLLKERISNLTEEEIKQAFNEIIDYNKKGVLSLEAFVRKIRNEYAKEIDTESWDRGCLFTSNEIIFEIAKRHYGVK
jgi:uncharacterized protein YcbK (DUF882 family)